MTKIFNVNQIREIDAFTIVNEPISSLSLMERAARKISDWLLNKMNISGRHFSIFCGPGNNGGDGLAIARMLVEESCSVHLYLLQILKHTSDDHHCNLTRLPDSAFLQRFTIKKGDPFPEPGQESTVIDAIFGSGLSRPLEGYWADLVDHLNQTGNRIIAVDIPSGLFADKSTRSTTIKAHTTLTFQHPKLAFMMPENYTAVGDWQILDIGLHPEIMVKLPSFNQVVTASMVQTVLRRRRKFDHKGSFGHALLICGGYGKVGAALLAARGCLRSGVGKLTVHIPKYAYHVIQTGIPEAMVEIDEHEYWFSGLRNQNPFQAIGIGCGLGTRKVTQKGLQKILVSTREPMILDADAINILAENPDWLKMLPKNTILTPHPGEYKRVFGMTNDSFERLEQQRKASVEYGVIIALKGAHTCITTASGEAYFNTTGNPGMATAGSGDVLTGIITGLVAQGHDPVSATLAGVYCHGLAGDIATSEIGEYSLIASDIIEHIGLAICKIQRS